MTVRWMFYDPPTGDAYLVPINPDSMTSVEPPTKAVRFARGRNTDSGGDLRTVTFLGKPVARDWEFGGAIRTQAHYQALRDWVAKNNAVRITDHLNRTFEVFLTDFVPTDRQPTPRVTWRLRYTVKAKILRRIS